MSLSRQSLALVLTTKLKTNKTKQTKENTPKTQKETKEQKN